MGTVYGGIDLGGTNIACALATEDGNFVCQRNIPTESQRGPKQFSKASFVS